MTKLKPLKKININKNNLNRPKDYILETISNASTPKTNPNAPREVQEGRDIDGKTTSE